MIISMFLATTLEHRKYRVVLRKPAASDLETADNDKKQYTGTGIFLTGIIWLVILAIRDMTRGTDIYGYFRTYSLTSILAICLCV